MPRRAWIGRLVPAVLVAAVAAVTAGFASGSAVSVTLTLAGSSSRDLGQAARLTATAKLPAGARLRIQAYAPGKASVVVGDCARSPCSGSFRDARPERVNFQAFAIKRAGKTVSTIGRSRRIAVSWSKPAPPPKPAALPGHFEGKTADNELFAFDIAPDGRTLTNLQTGQMNQSCEPAAYLSGGNVSATGPFPVALDGSFTITGSFTGTVGGSPSTNNVMFTGHVSAGTASGTYREDTFFSASDGTGYSCTTGNQTWTAIKIR
jgi:hypothetical protein